MVFASPRGCWLLAHDAPGRLEATWIRPGWHALTHSDLDDPGEPRTRWVRGRLALLAPRNASEAERALLDLLRAHGGGAPGEEPAPPVCLHAGRMVTVSSSILLIARNDVRYVHVEGRPCTGVALDCSHLLPGPLPVPDPS